MWPIIRRYNYPCHRGETHSTPDVGERNPLLANGKTHSVNKAFALPRSRTVSVPRTVCTGGCSVGFESERQLDNWSGPLTSLFICKEIAISAKEPSWPFPEAIFGENAGKKLHTRARRVLARALVCNFSFLDGIHGIQILALEFTPAVPKFKKTGIRASPTSGVEWVSSLTESFILRASILPKFGRKTAVKLCQRPRPLRCSWGTGNSCVCVGGGHRGKAVPESEYRGPATSLKP